MRARFCEMSRRSRRRNGQTRSSWLGRIVIGLLGAVVLVIGTGYLMLRNYLHSDGFRKFLSGEVSRAANVKGEFSPFRWDGLAVDTAAFEATGGGPLAILHADGLHTEIGFGGVSRGVWELNGTSIRRLEVAVDTTRKPDTEVPPEVKVPVTKKERPRPWYPSEVEVSGLEVRDLNVAATLKEGKVASARNLRVKVEPEGGKKNYRAEIVGGQIQLPGDFLPGIELEKVKARIQEKAFFITSASASVWGDGKLEMTGEGDLERKSYAFEGNANNIACEYLLNDSWAKRVTGQLSSDFVVESVSGEPQAHGSLKVDNAVLTALPVLDALAAYADTRRFRVLNLNEATADWRWKRGEITLNKLILSSDGLVRLEGNLVIRDKELDGMFRLGIAPGTLASIPGAETDVFVAGEKGLLWTNVRVTGSANDPKEDLTERLIAAAGLRMFEELPGTSQKVLKFSKALLGESPEEAVLKGVEAIEKGVEVIEKTEGIVREARDILKSEGGLLEGILGRKKEKKKDGE